MNKISKYIANLESYSVKELQGIWFEYFNKKTRVINKEYLIKNIAYKVQEKEYGGLSIRTQNILTKALREKNKETSSTNNSKIKPGTEICKTYKGCEFKILVLEKGYQFNGFIYNSLTKIAHLITGQKMSGPLFFGLKESKCKK